MRIRTHCGLALISSLLGVALFVPASEPNTPKKPDPVAQVRKAAETAEVHGLGLHDPLHYRLDGIKEFPALIATLQAKDKTAPVERVWELLGKETQKEVLANKASVDVLVALDLRKIVDSRPDFYTEEAFKTILLTKEMKDLVALGKKRTFLQTAKLNWWLLEKTFPNSIPEMPERFRTVRVQVVRGKDVILVLSSYNPCRWEVKLLEGAKVTGVVLCGYHAQEVAGVDAPVVYRCYYEPDGVTRTQGTPVFFGYDEKKESFKEFRECVKQITDKDFSSFQGKYQPKPGDEPFTVFPVANK